MPWPAPDTWLHVTGTWRPQQRSAEDQRPPILGATSFQAIPQPASPYLR